MATTRRTRNKVQQELKGENASGIAPRMNNKRVLEKVEVENATKKKRAVFGDITNAVTKKKDNNFGKQVLKKNAKKSSYLVAVPSRKSDTKNEEAISNVKTEPTDVSYEEIVLSQESVLGSQISNSSQTSGSSQSSTTSEVDALNEKNRVLSQEPVASESEPQIDDIDAEHDPTQVGIYAFHIFNYYKEREQLFKITDYMKVQTELSTNMRAILVDWLVEVQENFELNHETLYLAVKMVDIYLGIKETTKEKLQLIGATCLFIASKFDERCPPVLDDFVYICDNAYDRDEIIKCEMDVLKTIGFDIGIPLSYRFLRRYAKCCRAGMDVLTLARFILEMSLMNYDIARLTDSKIAAACLLLAITMKKSHQWDHQLIHYTGYHLEELIPIAHLLNLVISAPTSKNLATIRSKYSHKIFMQVALQAPLKSEDFENIISTLPADKSEEVRRAISQTTKTS